MINQSKVKSLSIKPERVRELIESIDKQAYEIKEYINKKKEINK